MRAIIKKQINSNGTAAFKGFEHWEQVTEAETSFSSQVPFRNERPYIIEQLRPVLYNQQWWLQDTAQALMPVSTGFKNIWKLLSLSGGEALNMAVIGKEKTFTPIGVWHHNEYKLL
ncbi:hypothetical protein [Paraflavitalea speifideaquila]|uniref:hypothetical protein n=1 Tax=Paraflavitalea speifideaquila TaxID=3076558 RepID=UPI0028E767F3|nr:hypothetical protein [Paraflavitalea speifideiaquila]